MYNNNLEAFNAVDKYFQEEIICPTLGLEPLCLSLQHYTDRIFRLSKAEVKFFITKFIADLIFN